MAFGLNPLHPVGATPYMATAKARSTNNPIHGLRSCRDVFGGIGTGELWESAGEIAPILVAERAKKKLDRTSALLTSET